ncbi:MAG: FAD-dependent oxidoreductase, partial [Spirochaetes bacterium]|nr:FAD-dependent oxidoreductase [Spirochaetota bacterium]
FQANKSSAQEGLNNPKIKVYWSHEPRAFLGGESFEKLEVENLKTGERTILDEGDGVFIFVGFIPQTELFGNALNTDKWGYIVTDENMATNIEGVYAIGDIRSKKYRQITTAVSDGTIAALESEHYIRNLKKEKAIR